MEKKEPQMQGEWLDRLSETINCIPWEASAETWEFTYVGPQAVKHSWVSHPSVVQKRILDGPYPSGGPTKYDRLLPPILSDP